MWQILNMFLLCFTNYHNLLQTSSYLSVVCAAEGSVISGILFSTFFSVTFLGNFFLLVYKVYLSFWNEILILSVRMILDQKIYCYFLDTHTLSSEQNTVFSLFSSCVLGLIVISSKQKSDYLDFRLSVGLKHDQQILFFYYKINSFLK